MVTLNEIKRKKRHQYRMPLLKTLPFKSVQRTMMKVSGTINSKALAQSPGLFISIWCSRKKEIQNSKPVKAL